MTKQSDMAVLVNISTQKWPPRHRTYLGSLDVRSPQNGEAYAVTPVRACKGIMDLGDKRTMEFAISAREIAEDIAREINGDSGEGSYHGVFVAAGSEPTQTELGEARCKLDEFHHRLWQRLTLNGKDRTIRCSSHRHAMAIIAAIQKVVNIDTVTLICARD